MERKRHRSQRFTSASGNSEREETRLVGFALFDTGMEDLIALAVDLAGWILESLQVRVHFFAQGRDVLMPAAWLLTSHVRFGFLEIRVYKRRVNHAYQKRKRKSEIIFGRLLWDDWQAQWAKLQTLGKCQS